MNFTTAEDSQRIVTFPIRQGESPAALDNVLLGMFHLTGFPVGLRGSASFDVTFDIDRNGVLSVSARDRVTGSSNGIVLENITTGGRRQHIAEMITDAEQYRKQERERIGAKKAREALESECYAIRDRLEDGCGGISVATRLAVESECESKLEWLEQNPDAGQVDCESRLADLRVVAKGMNKRTRT